MSTTKKKSTPGQELWFNLYRADLYDQEAEKIIMGEGVPRLNPDRMTKRWLEGMSRNLKERFPTGLRKRREELGLTQQQLANMAELTVTAVAMIERSERVPNLDTA